MPSIRLVRVTLAFPRGVIYSERAMVGACAIRHEMRLY
jgi:hypothetical protein